MKVALLLQLLLLRCLLVPLLLLRSGEAGKPAMGVCITGQLKRMEFWSKVYHILAPNMDRYDIRLLFVLDPESIEAVNEHKYLGMPVMMMDEQTIAKNVHRHCPTCAVAVDFYQQPLLPSVARRYVAELDKFKINDTKARLRRAVVHSRLFYSWSRCYQGFMRDSAPMAYDVFLRIREDLFVPKPIVVSSGMYAGAVCGMEWCGWGGLSDRAAMLDAKYAYQYFVGPFTNMMVYYNNLRMNHEVSNPETFFSASLKFDNVPLRGLDVETFPYFVTRRRADGSICFADELGKVGSRMECVAPSMQRMFSMYRCSNDTSLPDAEDIIPRLLL